MKRSSGVLLHISSLPSPHGIGTFGRAAYDFVDFLKRAGQSYWQVLPLSPTSYGDSPYQSSSTFALNPYFIDLDLLCEDGLLTSDEIPTFWGNEENRVDYGLMYSQRFTVLRRAFSRFNTADMQEFCRENADWLEGYALYCALKEHFSGRAWYEWPIELKRREPGALEYWRNELSGELDFHRFMQYEAELQWRRLRDYAGRNGIGFIGDVPIYVPFDSADLWQEPWLFQLDENLNPTEVAGVPPDYFSETGQLWGNPLYNWDRHSEDGFLWWRRRINKAGERCPVVRIDHFRGLESYWAVPVDKQTTPDGRPTAAAGMWRKGPDMALISALKQGCPGIEIIAEDLGFLTPAVKRMLSASGFAGMRVMQFGFDPMSDSRELPHNYPVHCVAYLGTHDNVPMRGWIHETTPECVEFAVNYLGLNEREGLCFGFIRGLFTSVAELCVVQAQDLLDLGAEERMNLPSGTGWWRYRLRPGELTPRLADRLAYYTRMSGRATGRK